jgi:hypothetical protein
LSKLEDARRHRLELAENLLDARAELVLNAVGLTDERVTELAVGPAAREKLKGILKRLARKKHPFSQCMRDLAKHRSELPVESRKRICGRLKSMIKGTGRVKALSQTEEDGACMLIDEDVAKLILAVDDDKLASLINEEES